MPGIFLGIGHTGAGQTDIFLHRNETQGVLVGKTESYVTQVPNQLCREAASSWKMDEWSSDLIPTVLVVGPR